MCAGRIDRATFVRPVAHRGLHDSSAGLIENSLPAFEAAIAADFAIECDVRAGPGGLPAVLHDRSLDRIFGRAGVVDEISAADFTELSYPDGSPILTLAALFEMVAGRVPLLVEMKSDGVGSDAAFLAQTARLAANYRGPLAVMSFDAGMIRGMRRLSAEVPRGLVLAAPKAALHRRDGPDETATSHPPRLAQFVEVEASFAAYCVDGLPSAESVRLREMGIPVFAWTVRDDAQLNTAQAHADAAIFEGSIRARVIDTQ